MYPCTRGNFYGAHERLLPKWPTELIAIVLQIHLPSLLAFVENSRPTMERVDNIPGTA